MLFNIYFIDSASAYDRDMKAHAFLAICDSDQSRKKTRLAGDEKTSSPMSTELTTKIENFLSI